MRSYRLAQAAVQGGVFKDEIVPVVKKGTKGDVVVSEDEEPFKVDFAKLTQLRAVFQERRHHHRRQCLHHQRRCGASRCWRRAEASSAAT